MNKITVGLDCSFRSPGISVALVDEEFNIVYKKFLSFTSVKKYEYNKDGSQIIHVDTKKKYPDKTYDYDLQHIEYYVETILDFIYHAEERELLDVYVAIEDYAFSASGNITALAEMCHGIKSALYNSGAKLRIYNIASIKIFATDKGNADKVMMEDSYELLEDKFDLSFLPLVRLKKAGNPKDNIVDAFFLMEYLRLELKVRAGLIELKDMPERKRELFLRVTKSNPHNILSMDFISNSYRD